MYKLIQTLWDQMRSDLHAGQIPQIQHACQVLLSGELGPLTDFQCEDLESMDRSLEKLVARIEGEPIDWADYSEAAHALRGPLNATIGFSRLMIKGIDGPITEEQKGPLETIHGGSRRMLALFNLLLDALMLIQGDLGLGAEPMPTREILDELTKVGEALADSRDFVFKADVDPSAAEISVHSNKKYLMQALLALLAVSAKYLKHKTSTLHVRPDDDKLLIQLKNQGCQQPAPLPADPSALLTGEAPFTIPYDVHLRLGLAWHILAGMQGQLQIYQADQTCTFTVTVPTA
jgi:signal transduction histidine kinase